MKSYKIMLVAVVSLFVMTCLVPCASAAETLKSKLHDAGWDGVVGIWVDPETKGKKITATYSWKIADQVIEIFTKDQGNETVALMVVNGKTGELFHMGADKKGSSSLGSWKIDRDGVAILSLAYTSAEGQQGTLNIRHRLRDKDTMEVTIELAQPIRYTLVRKKK